MIKFLLKRPGRNMEMIVGGDQPLEVIARLVGEPLEFIPILNQVGMFRNMDPFAAKNRIEAAALNLRLRGHGDIRGPVAFVRMDDDNFISLDLDGASEFLNQITYSWHGARMDI